MREVGVYQAGVFPSGNTNPVLFSLFFCFKSRSRGFGIAHILDSIWDVIHFLFAYYPGECSFLTLRNCLSSLLDFGAKKRLLRKIPTLQPLISLFKDFLRADLAHQQELVHPSLEFKALLVAQREASMQLVFSKYL